MRRIRTLVAVAVLPLATGGYFVGIGCERDRQIRASTVDGFQATPAGTAAPVHVALFGDLGYNHHGVTDFARIWEVLGEGRRERRNVVFTARGYEGPPADRLVLALSLPARARTGDRFAVARAFAPPPDTAGGGWGFRPAGEAEVAFARTRAGVPHPPYHHRAHYAATAATGAVEVLHRDRDGMRVAVDVRVSDAAGRAHRVAGTLRLTLRDEGEVCFSP